jgi:hypothetical protein
VHAELLVEAQMLSESRGSTAGQVVSGESRRSARSRINRSEGGLRAERESLGAVAGDDRRCVELRSKPGSSDEMSFGDHEVGAFALELLRARSTGSPLSAANPTSTGRTAPPRAAPQRAENVRRAHQ